MDFMLTTKQKLALARVAQKGVMAARSVVRLGPRAEVTRRHARWVLDLREGIDFSIWLMGAFEVSTVRAYEKLIKPGQTVLDVGANVGAHSIHFARAVGPAGKVYAFEPTDYAFAKLQANIAANPDLARRIECHQVMLVDKAEDKDIPPLYSSWPLDSAAGAHTLHGGRLMSATNATSTTLDAFLAKKHIDRVDLIKIDIDGNECTMLRGALNSLARLRPILLMEVSPHQLEESGSNVEELVAILQTAGYGLEEVHKRKSLPMDGKRLRSLIPHGGSRNAIARPG
jgi:FkbM family methyltransferase